MRPDGRTGGHAPRSWRVGTMTTSSPLRSVSMRGVPATTSAGGCSMRLSAPADMAGTGVPLLFRFYFLAETNLTGERPFHTRKQTSPDNAKARQPTTQTGENSQSVTSPRRTRLFDHKHTPRLSINNMACRRRPVRVGDSCNDAPTESVNGACGT